MAVVMSGWAISPPAINGMLNAAEWADAGSIPIPAGYLLAKNDAEYLYLALDMVGDRGNDPGTRDYFWLTVDVDGNASITPNTDVNYGLYPSPPHPPSKLGRQLYLGPGRWTGLLNDPSPSGAKNGFGPTPRSRAPHRIWEMRLALNEIGADLSPGADPPVVRVGLRTVSSNPAFTFDSPANFFRDFSDLHQILLTAGPSYPSATAGPVIAGVGLIPTGEISSSGYATTDPSYYLHVRDSAFAGRMNLIGNRTTLSGLWGLGGRKYRMLHRLGSGAFEPIDQTWTNYRWTGGTFLLESVGPDASHLYPLPNPAAHYSINDLLLQWSSGGFANGLHQFQIEFFTATGTPVPAPPQTVSLRLDNSVPTVDLVDVLHDGASVPACAIVNMTGPTDGVRLEVTAWEPEGHLGSYRVSAHWGDGASTTIASESYPAPPGHTWNGIQNVLVPAGEFVPPVTCAYQFRVSAWLRATNGYTAAVGPVADTRHVTLIKPGAGLGAGPTAIPERLSGDRVLGLGTPDQPDEGTTPELLGTETIDSEQ